MSERAVRIGSGAGYSGDRIDPAVDLARRGELDYLVFECLGERTTASAQLARQADPDAGFDPLLEARMRAVLPWCAGKTRVITNMGAANPDAAAERVAAIAAELGNPELRVACVTGDDVLHLVSAEDAVSANAYLGADPVVAALRAGADVVITGRVADAALFLAPMRYEFGWAADDWDLLAAGTVVGHLLECAGQLTGGYFADPVSDPVPELARLGFPLAVVRADGSAELTKLPDTGGRLDRLTVTAQLLYEVDDPARYLTPDVTVDLTGVRVEEIAPDVVRLRGARGAAAPRELKALIGRRAGFLGEGEISYRGPGARARARLAGEVVLARLDGVHGLVLHEPRVDLIGCADDPAAEPPEVRLRVAARTASESDAALIGWEVETLYTNGPAGGGGARRSVRPVLELDPVFLPRAEVAGAVRMVGEPG
nr:acyclic terpene utilization AtuA family protein [Tamaricihabitans halophyticus]